MAVCDATICVQGSSSLTTWGVSDGEGDCREMGGGHKTMGGHPKLPPHLLPGPITSVCFSKDGQCTLAASLDSTLRLLDKETGEMLGE